MGVPLGLFWEASRFALQSIWAHKLRTFLTLLGIIIGVASVMVVSAGIEGLETYVTETVSRTLGSNSFILAKFAHLGDVSREEWERMNRRNKDLRFSDIEYVRRNCPACLEVAGELSSRRDLTFGSNELLGTQVSGVTANTILLGGLEVVEGRYFSLEEERRSRSLCVIGFEVKEKLFGNRDPIGQILKLQNQPLQVIGVFEKQGTSFGISLDNILHLPLSTYQKIYGTRQSIVIRGTTAGREDFETAMDQVRLAMRIRHKLSPSEEDDFGLISTEEINSAVDQFTNAIAMVVIPITVISLLVGGIVVMNIMLVSVTERTFEVGLRKSLGARRKDILRQFLIESFFLASSGGVVGLVVAVLISELIESTTPMTMTISPGYVLLSIGFSGGIGIIFGVYPAFKASKLDPIEALRTER